MTTATMGFGARRDARNALYEKAKIVVMREVLGEHVYLRLYAAGGCAVPFAEQGDVIRKECLDAVDAVLDGLATPSMIYLMSRHCEYLGHADPVDVLCRALLPAIKAIKEGK